MKIYLRRVKKNTSEFPKQDKCSSAGTLYSKNMSVSVHLIKLSSLYVHLLIQEKGKKGKENGKCYLIQSYNREEVTIRPFGNCFK